MAAITTRTARVVITDALVALGVLAAAETPSAEDADASLRVLIDMLARWSADPAMEYHPELWGDTETDENITTPWNAFDDIVTPVGRDRTAVSMPTTVATLDDTIALPGEYFSALRYNLATELSIIFQTTPSAVLVTAAQNSIGVVKRRNTIKPVISLSRELPGPTLSYPTLNLFTRS